MKRHTTILGSVYESFAQKTPVAVIDKLKHTEPGVLSGLVRRTAQELEPVVKQTGGTLPSPY